MFDEGVLRESSGAPARLDGVRHPRFSQVVFATFPSEQWFVHAYQTESEESPDSGRITHGGYVAEAFRWGGGSWQPSSSVFLPKDGRSTTEFLDADAADGWLALLVREHPTKGSPFRAVLVARASEDVADFAFDARKLEACLEQRLTHEFVGEWESVRFSDDTASIQLSDGNGEQVYSLLDGSGSVA